MRRVLIQEKRCLSVKLPNYIIRKITTKVLLHYSFRFLVQFICEHKENQVSFLLVRAVRKKERTLGTKLGIHKWVPCIRHQVFLISLYIYIFCTFQYFYFFSCVLIPKKKKKKFRQKSLDLRLIYITLEPTDGEDSFKDVRYL